MTSSFKRERYVPRIVGDPDDPIQLPDGREIVRPVRLSEGTERGSNLAVAFAETANEGLIEALLHHFAALNQFGGELYISAARRKFGANGLPVGHNEPGEHETVGFIFHYSKSARAVKDQPDEPDATFGQAEAPTIEDNGTPSEPVEVEDPAEIQLARSPEE